MVATSRKRILILHGNRQSGQLFLGRLDKFRKRVSKELEYDFVAPDAPFPHVEDKNLRTWWNRNGNDYEGLKESLQVVEEYNDVVGIVGFSQGARFAHLLALLNLENSSIWFPNLSFIILVAGYDATLPKEMPPLTNSTTKGNEKIVIPLPSLHVWGLNDKLVTPDQSRALSERYADPTIFTHDGNHYVPSKAQQIQKFLDFIQQSVTKSSKDPSKDERLPDEETITMQEEEIEALEAIFVEEVTVLSRNFPIHFQMKLVPTDPDDEEGNNWPRHPLALDITFPFDYPLESIPKFSLIHNNNIYEFPSKRVETVMRIVKESSEAEIGMPSILSCVYAVKEYLDSPARNEDIEEKNTVENQTIESDELKDKVDAEDVPSSNICPKSSTFEDISFAILEGLGVAEKLLSNTESRYQSDTGPASFEKGGAFWTYTIGLVGKPSAGKSTFFNAASAFSKQRGVTEGISEWGGASVAAHPFTTINPNIGYCLVPAPMGSCPEDYVGSSAKDEYGSMHGRDSQGRRFIPILLKDVAGLVPGAYEGRGRGNQFLNDLCDANVLIHVVDASGTADAQGNSTGDSDLTNPLDDLQWIRSELVEWVYGNLMKKWDTIIRKGRRKLSGMFSGYGQSQAMTEQIFSAIERHMEERYQKYSVFETIEDWTSADVHRLVSAFLGVRFPMALALNKYDLPSSKKHVLEIQESLPIHGALVGIPMTAKSEMDFVHQHLTGMESQKSIKAPSGVWQCLTSAMQLCEPVFVFPVSDMSTYSPIPGLSERATGHPSLPSLGMIRCIQGSGGLPPTCWNAEQKVYLPPRKEQGGKQTKLRDVIPMKPGSTVTDVFLALKNIGCLQGEFVRAEAAGEIGEKPNLVTKTALLGKHNRILKIMTTKRTAWQS